MYEMEGLKDGYGKPLMSDREPKILVAYNGYGKPYCFIADERQTRYLFKSYSKIIPLPASASLWIIPNQE